MKAKPSSVSHNPNEAIEDSLLQSKTDDIESQEFKRSKKSSHTSGVSIKRQTENWEEYKITPSQQSPQSVLSETTDDILDENRSWKLSKEFEPNSEKAKNIKNQFIQEYDSLKQNLETCKKIEKEEVRDRIQVVIAGYFNFFRTKIDELESKTIKKVEESTNLDQILKTNKEFIDELETDKLDENYYQEAIKNEDIHEKDIESIRKHNSLLVTHINQINRKVKLILDICFDESMIVNTLNNLASQTMLIDQVEPDFSDNDESSKLMEKAREDIYLARLVRYSVNSSNLNKQLSTEQKNVYYYPIEDKLYWREIKDGVATSAKIMPLQLYFQNVVTMPTKEGNDVYLLGGTKESQPIEAIANCYKIDLNSKALIPIEQLPYPKYNFAAWISEDYNIIFVAGGSSGSYIAVNTCQMYVVDEKRWIGLKTLNTSRFSASIVSCPNRNLYIFSGVGNYPSYTTKNKILNSIERLDYSNLDNEWVTLSIGVPYLTTKPGVIYINKNKFLVFGGWMDTFKDDVAIIWKPPKNGWRSKKMNEDKCLEYKDAFLNNGLVLKGKDDNTFLVFGLNFAHIYHKNEKVFEILENKG